MKIRHKSPDKNRRVNSQRGRTLDAGFIYQGNRYQVDDCSHGRIMSRAVKLLINSSIPSVEWRSLDNRRISFTRDEFLSFAVAVDHHIEQTMQQSWSQKDAATG